VKLCFSNLGFVEGRPIVRFRRRVIVKSDGWRGEMLHRLRGMDAPACNMHICF